MQALSIQNLIKTYENGTQALSGIDLNVSEGDFFALLGPNGAGKSTTIGIMTSLVNKTSGSVKIFNHDIDTQLELAKSCIGLVPQEFNFNIFEKVGDVVVNQAGYYGVSRRIAKQRAKYYLKKLDLWDKHNKTVITLSGGMKRRLMIVRALIHEPKLLVLDEPTAGVDIEIRRSMWSFVREMNKQGVTIILTTHYLEEAENLCKSIAIINKGMIIENTNMKDLLSKLNIESFIFDLQNKIETLPEHPQFALRLIDNKTLEADLSKNISINELFAFFQTHHIQVSSMRNKANRLEELFLHLINQDHHE